MSPPTPSTSPLIVSLEWRRVSPIVRLWAFWFTLLTLFACGVVIVWGVTQFATSSVVGVSATGGGLLLGALFGAHAVALRRGWGFGWTLQLAWSGVFLTSLLLSFLLKLGFASGTTVPTRDKVLLFSLLVPALVHVWILANWFKSDVKAWFGRVGNGVAPK